MSNNLNALQKELAIRRAWNVAFQLAIIFAVVWFMVTTPAHAYALSVDDCPDLTEELAEGYWWYVFLWDDGGTGSCRLAVPKMDDADCLETEELIMQNSFSASYQRNYISSPQRYCSIYVYSASGSTWVSPVNTEAWHSAGDPMSSNRSYTMTRSTKADITLAEHVKASHDIKAGTTAYWGNTATWYTSVGELLLEGIEWVAPTPPETLGLIYALPVDMTLPSDFLFTAYWEDAPDYTYLYFKEHWQDDEVLPVVINYPLESTDERLIYWTFNDWGEYEPVVYLSKCPLVDGDFDCDYLEAFLDPSILDFTESMKWEPIFAIEKLGSLSPADGEPDITLGEEKMYDWEISCSSGSLTSLFFEYGYTGFNAGSGEALSFSGSSASGSISVTYELDGSSMITPRLIYECSYVEGALYLGGYTEEIPGVSLMVVDPETDLEMTSSGGFIPVHNSTFSYYLSQAMQDVVPRLGVLKTVQAPLAPLFTWTFGITSMIEMQMARFTPLGLIDRLMIPEEGQYQIPYALFGQKLPDALAGKIYTIEYSDEGVFPDSVFKMLLVGTAISIILPML